MTRAQLIQRLVLNAICDDFENVDQRILREVADVGAECGFTIQRRDVVEALDVLVTDGLAKACDLSGTRDPMSGELARIPPLDIVEENFRTYFYATEKGMEFHKADDKWWPLDEEGALRPDWSPPEV